MTHEEREKTAAVCETCGAICVAWILSDESVVPVSTTVKCECDETVLRVFEGTETLANEE
ncbi:hypothetical protein CV102_24590 [Natronococcus pandeyae]|uniref:Uncharacterized protein n=1 Tax=Natronococcus pandeyae TaxID=2055836 RepID=A0A8J8Q2P7_9EURY|nr:hypothetical protein CV102_24590 [Natronococcus pandeyae]